ncbi:hypothetical protein FQZ97_1274950 [compost metagenome]
MKVASKAKKSTARATSADVPWRRIGVIWSPSRMNSARSSVLASVTPSVGVSMKPGLTTFTRMPRVTSSAAKPDAIERSAALVAL